MALAVGYRPARFLLQNAHAGGGLDEIVMAGFIGLKRDDFPSDRHPALAYCWSMIFSENRHPPRITSGAGFFGIMLCWRIVREPARGI
jgi:hypothetical protein